MHRLYTVLFACSILLINPWGGSRGEIWTVPKVAVVLLIAIFNGVVVWEARQTLRVPRVWWWALGLWVLFLGMGLLSVLISPFPDRAFWGQAEMGDGWPYWLLMAGFSLSNTLLLRVQPTLFQAQVRGLCIGGALLALSAIPQCFDWTLDYTTTSGQKLKANVLVSTVFDNHQPIGLYSHRGHSSLVLAVVGTLALLSGRWGWLRRWQAGGLLALAALGLGLMQTRASVLALGLAMMYLLRQRYRRWLLPLLLVSVLVIGLLSTTRQVADFSGWKRLSSDRVYLWQMSQRGIEERPWLGWGFDGFGIAYPHIWQQKLWRQAGREPPSVLTLAPFSFVDRNEQGQLQTIVLPGNKSHNLLLDWLLSVGVLGSLIYGLLVGVSFWQMLQFSGRGLEAVVLVYGVFGLLWFDCAQYSHLLWWTLSCWPERT